MEGSVQKGVWSRKQVLVIDKKSRDGSSWYRGSRCRCLSENLNLVASALLNPQEAVFPYP